MRRTILLLATVGLVLALAGPPAAAVPKDMPVFHMWCDLDGDPATGTGSTSTPVGSIPLDGREDIPDQAGWGTPAWTLGVHAPSIFFGGSLYRYVSVDGEWVLDLSGEFPGAPGMESKATYCLAWGFVGQYLVVWDPAFVFYPPPAIPPTG